MSKMDYELPADNDKIKRQVLTLEKHRIIMAGTGDLALPRVEFGKMLKS